MGESLKYGYFEDCEHVREPDIEDVDEARAFIQTAVEKGELPVISVPVRYAEAIKKGIQKSSSWIGGDIIAATLSRDPYQPNDEDRVLLKVHIDADHIQPRFTGPDEHFHGVVVLSGPIAPAALEMI